MKKIRFSNDIIKIKFILIGLFLILSFAFIIYKLYIITLVNNGYYENELTIRENKTYISKYAKRGRILDRNGKVIVDNEEVYTINYIKEGNISYVEEIELAKELIKFLSLDYDKVSNKILKNYFYILNTDKLINKANKNVIEKYKDRTISKSDYEIYLKKLIKESDIKSMTEEDKKTAYLFYLMNIGYRNCTKLIKYDLTAEEAKKIAKYYDKGFTVGVNYKRVYPYGSTFKAYLGTLGSIREEDADYYLSKGYRRDDIVGVSYLENQYEEILKGQNEEYSLTAQGKRIVVKELANGKDIKLTIDIDLQKDIENIIYNEIIKAKKEANTTYYNKSFVILSNPSTGEIYASAGVGVVGKKHLTKVDYLTDLTNYAVTPGSIVKGASHIVGYKYGAIKIGTTVTDSCIKVKNSPKKCSWKSLGKINDLTALKYSSNYYQFLIAIKIGQGKYKYNTGLKLNPDGFKKYREVYNEFGLGVKTGLDIPNENIGYVGKDNFDGALLDYPIGQYETYTPMQLIQYINTLATGGLRYQLHYLKEYDDYKFGNTILNKVNIEDIYITRVKEGFEMVMGTGGTGKGYINAKYSPAGKTGTAESFIDLDKDGKIDTETISRSFVAYMPYDKPKLSIVVLSPDVSDGKTKYYSKVNKRITYEVTDLFFKKYNIE